VTVRTREIYHSANDDRWLLAHDSDNVLLSGSVDLTIQVEEPA
jgi:hypothetical protein